MCNCDKLKDAKEKLDAAQKEYDKVREEIAGSPPQRPDYIMPIYIAPQNPPWYPPWTITTRNNTASSVDIHLK